MNRSPDADGNHASQLAAPTNQADTEPEINALFRMAVEHEATDLHLKVGRPPRVRVHGRFQTLEDLPLSPQDVERLTFPLLTPAQVAVLADQGSVSFSHVVGQGECRFHVSLFRQRGDLSLAARRVRDVIPRLEELGLPDAVAKLCEAPAGLIVVAGGPGSGKRTKVAAMLDWINERYPLHILIVEDAIAFEFTDKEACVNQRQAGTDFHDRLQALRDAAQLDPDVLSVGELRDAETVEVALRAAETGQLVFGTSDAKDAPATITGILSLFPPEKRGAIRQALANNLRAVVAQKLIKGIKKDRVPATEILIVNPLIRKLIVEARDCDLSAAIVIGRKEGMIDFSESLRQLVERGDVEKITALEVAPNPEQLKMVFKGIKVAAAGILGDPTPPLPPAAPVLAQAPAAPARTAAPAKSVSPPTVRRKATVRYFTRMYPNRLYRLLVVLSGEEVRKLLRNEVGQATSEGFTVRVQEPIEVEPLLPGCTVYPPRREVIVSGEEPVEARFQILAHTQGGCLEEPVVVLRQAGRELARVLLKVRVGKPTLAFGLAAASVVVPVLLKYLKLDLDAQAGANFNGYWQLLQTILALPWWTWTTPLLLAAGVAAWWCWPREDVFWNVQLDSPPPSGPRWRRYFPASTSGVKLT